MTQPEARNRFNDINRLIATFLFLLLLTPGVSATDSLTVKIRSRALLDATLSGYGKESVQGYYKLEDFRIGFKAFYGIYEVKADIGYSSGKWAFKDLLFNFHFPHSVLSVGNGYEAYSMDMLTSTFDMRFHQSASSVLAFTDGRKLGATYHYYRKHIYGSTGLYTYNDINKIGKSQKNAFISTSRLVFRPRMEKECLLHVGGAFTFRSKPINKETDTEKTIKSDGVTSLLGTPLMEATLQNPGAEYRGILELLFTGSRYMVQGEYFLNNYRQEGQLKAFRPHGGYLQGSYLIIGKGFQYDPVYAIPGRPSSDQALEITARYNYTNLNDTRAGIYGGKESDLSLGANFYLNKYIGIKLSASYVFTGKNCNSFYSKNLFIGQLRLQYVF